MDKSVGTIDWYKTPVPHGEMRQLDPIGRLYLDSLLVHQKLFVVLWLNPSIPFGIFRSAFCGEVCGCRTCVDHSSIPCKL